MSTLAVIPARGGSKSVPRKNLLPLARKPLIAHTIGAALAARLVDRVVVSTDDPEIREIALRYGAEVIDRPAELATDTATSESALLHALDHLEAKEGYQPDLLVFLQCTSPFTLADDVDGTIARLRQESASSAFTAARFHGFVWSAEDGAMVGVNHDKEVRQRRQDRPVEYLETGAVYAMRVDGFRMARHRFFGRTAIYEVPAERALEIDEPSDFAKAAALFSVSERKRRAMPQDVKGLVLDFDGVFTDDLVIVDQDGREAVACSRRDGMGIELLRESGLPMVVISKERVPIVSHRCAKLGLEVHYGVESKLGLLKQWIARQGITAAETIYVGNDVNDIECMLHVGFAVAPADAHESAVAAADLVLARSGGKGAVRELADMILERSTRDR